MGPEYPAMTLSVTNGGVPQDEPASQSSSSHTSTTPHSTATDIINRADPATPIPPSVIQVTIATNITPSDLIFDWYPVNVPPGRYILIATLPTASAGQFSSSSFLVLTGTNTSCLFNIASTTTLAPSLSSSSTHHPASMSSSGVPTTPIPASDIDTSGSSTNIRTIVGVSIGMGTFVLAIVAAWFYIYRKTRVKNPGNERPARPGHQWNGLGSADSRRDFAAANVSKGYRSSIPGSVATTTGMGLHFDDDDDDDDAVILGAEKNNANTTFLQEHGVPLSALPVLHRQSQGPTQTYSASSSTTNVVIMNDQSPSTVKKSIQGSAGPYVDSSSAYPPSVPFPISPPLVTPNTSQSHSQNTVDSTQISLSLSSLSSQQPSTSISDPLPSPPPPVPVSNRETKQLNRQSMGMKRKPVPVYDPDNELVGTPTSPAFNTVPSSSPSPLPSFSPTAETTGVYDRLTHRASFGPGGIDGKPIHYLIPDMPMSSLNRS